MKELSSIIGKSLLGIAVGALAFGSVAQAQDLAEVNVIVPNDSSCGIYPQWNATILGYWADSGVKVNILPSETTVPYVAFLQNGDADVVTLDAAQVLQAAENGLPIKVIYEMMHYAPEGIYVRADSDIQGLADLHDKTIGMASDRDLITTIIAVNSIGKTLEEMNITNFVVGDSAPVMAAALRDGTVQAIAGSPSDFAGMEAAGIEVRDITPPEVSRNPGNNFVVWGPTFEDNREKIAAFLRGFAMAQHAGVIDTKLSASVCRSLLPDQFENLETGMRMIDTFTYLLLLRRTPDYGELRPDVWASIQGPYVKLGEISKEMDPATFLDGSLIEAANDFTQDQVNAGLAKWKAANPDLVIN